MLASKFIVPSFVLLHVLMWGSCRGAQYFDTYNVFPRNNCLLCRIIASFITYGFTFWTSQSICTYMISAVPLSIHMNLVSKNYKLTMSSLHLSILPPPFSPNISALCIVNFTWYSSYLRTSDWTFRFVGIRHNGCKTWHQFLLLKQHDCSLFCFIVSAFMLCLHLYCVLWCLYLKLFWTVRHKPCMKLFGTGGV